MLVGRAFQCSSSGVLYLVEEDICLYAREWMNVVQYKIFRNGKSNKVTHDYHLCHKIPYWCRRLWLISPMITLTAGNFKVLWSP